MSNGLNLGQLGKAVNYGLAVFSKEGFSEREDKRGDSLVGVPPFGGIDRSIVRSGFRRSWGLPRECVLKTTQDTSPP
jgi:hypothetical protein